MTPRQQLLIPIALVAMFVAGLIIGQSSRAASPQPPEPVSTWRPVVVGTPHRSAGTSVAVGTETAPLTEGDPGGVPPSPAVPSPEPTASAVSTPAKPPQPVERTPPVAGTSVTGTASWFCRPPTSACTAGYPASGLYAAAGPALRVGAWRGRWVTVNGLRLRLVDWCQCGGGRVIDLYSSVVTALGLPLSRGVYAVTVRW